MKNYIQKVASTFCAILLFVCVLPFGGAYAVGIPETTFGTLMQSALEAIEITTTANATYSVYAINNMLKWLNEPFQINNNEIDYVPLTNNRETIADYMNRSVISIRPDAITIDGVEYSDIWISSDAANAFRINAYDFVTAWNIASQSNGTYAEGAGYFTYEYDDNLVPAYSLSFGGSSGAYAQFTGVPKDIGTYQVYWLYVQNIGQTNDKIRAYTYLGNRYLAENLNLVSSYPCEYTIVYEYPNGPVLFRRLWGNPWQYHDVVPLGTRGISFIADPFEFDFVAGSIPAESIPIPFDEGIKIQLPTTQINTWLVDYGDTYIDQQITFNASDTNLVNAFDSLLSLVYESINDTEVNVNISIDHDGEGPTPTPTPTPPPAPTPPYPSPTPSTDTNLISNTNWSALEAWLQNIRDILRAIYEYVKQIVEYYLENIHADLFAIDQKIDTIIEKLEGIGEDISNKLSLIYADIGDITVDIGSFLDDFIIDLEQAPIKLADKTIDILKLVFLPILTRLRDALGIWHYVVTWINSIAGPFAYFVNILSSANPAFMTPIYACVAGTLCILVYKRFGR